MNSNKFNDAFLIEKEETKSAIFNANNEIYKYLYPNYQISIFNDLKLANLIEIDFSLKEILTNGKVNLDSKNFSLNVSQLYKIVDSKLDLKNFYFRIDYLNIRYKNYFEDTIVFPIEIKYFNPQISIRQRSTFIYKEIKIDISSENLELQLIRDKIDFYFKNNNFMDFVNFNLDPIEAQNYIRNFFNDKADNLVETFNENNFEVKIFWKDVFINKNDINYLDILFDVVLTKNNKKLIEQRKVSISDFANYRNDINLLKAFEEAIEIELKYGTSFLNVNLNLLKIEDLEITKVIKNFQCSITQIKSIDNLQKNALVELNIFNQEKNQKFIIEKHIGKKQHLFLFDQNEKENHPVDLVRLDMRNIDRRKLLNLIKQFPIDEEMSSPNVAGGYKEFRSFYADSGSTQQIHIGEDISANAYTKLFSFAKAKIISAYAKKTNFSASGLGGQIVMEIQKNDLNLDSKIKEKYFKNIKAFHFFFAHLDPESLSLLGKVEEIEIYNNKYLIVTDIKPMQPLEIAENQLFAKVGPEKNNGGWGPHVHVEVYPIFNSKISPLLNESYEVINKNNLRNSEEKVNNYFFNGKFQPWNLKIEGTYNIPCSSVEKDFYFNIEKFFENRQSIDPNLFFAFRDEKILEINIDSIVNKI